MIQTSLAPRWAIRLPMLALVAFGVSACMGGSGMSAGSKSFASSMSAPIAPPLAYDERLQSAVATATTMRARGQRVWCVPFARNASGIFLRGDAKEWWGKANGVYDRGHEPKPGAIMAFSATRKNPRGHLAVVSEVVSDREILIDHANWSRNKVSLRMKVIDVSDKGDWSRVRVESTPGTLGRPYPITGFIYPNTI